jgi:hypothetical protein
MSSADIDLLNGFHEEAYNGKQHTDEEIKAAHEAWWRLATDAIKQKKPTLEVMLLLIYTMKYLPQTYD